MFRCRSLLGILLDVSGSMRAALVIASDSPRENEQRAGATIRGLLERLENYPRRRPLAELHDMVFVQAVGLQELPQADWLRGTCDLLPLLQHADELARDWTCPPDQRGKDLLLKLADEHHVRQRADKWVTECKFTDQQCWYLYRALERDPARIKPLIDSLPSYSEELAYDAAQAAVGTTTIMVGAAFQCVPGDALAPLVLAVGGGVSKSVGEKSLKTHPARLQAENAIRSATQDLQSRILRPEPVPQPRAQVAATLRAFLGSTNVIADPFMPLEGFIFGRTPLRTALQVSRTVFSKYHSERSTLFVLSDGEATDCTSSELIGRELGTEANALKAAGVTIACCFLTDKPVGASGVDKRLYTEPDPAWPPGVRALFEMSSDIAPSAYDVQHLTNAGWTLPHPGDTRPCKLFARVCTKAALDEFCKFVTEADKSDEDTYVTEQDNTARSST